MIVDERDLAFHVVAPPGALEKLFSSGSIAGDCTLTIRDDQLQLVGSEDGVDITATIEADAFQRFDVEDEYALSADMQEIYRAFDKAGGGGNIVEVGKPVDEDVLVFDRAGWRHAHSCTPTKVTEADGGYETFDSPALEAEVAGDVFTEAFEWVIGDGRQEKVEIGFDGEVYISGAVRSDTSYERRFDTGELYGCCGGECSSVFRAADLRKVVTCAPKETVVLLNMQNGGAMEVQFAMGDSDLFDGSQKGCVTHHIPPT